MPIRLAQMMQICVTEVRKVVEKYNLKFCKVSDILSLGIKVTLKG